jgi:hypothetical protein
MQSLAMIVCELLTISNTTAEASNTTPISFISVQLHKSQLYSSNITGAPTATASLKQQQHHSIP